MNLPYICSKEEMYYLFRLDILRMPTSETRGTTGTLMHKKTRQKMVYFDYLSEDSVTGCLTLSVDNLKIYLFKPPLHFFKRDRNRIVDASQICVSDGLSWRG